MFFRQVPSVTVCVPVHNGGRYVAATLDSITKQTYPRLSVLISDDASDDDSVAICHRFSDDIRFQLTVHPARCGWVENCNGLLSRAQGDFICIVPQDDIIGPHYIEALTDCLRSDSAASLSFCDIQAFGLFETVLSQVSIRGRAAERIQQFIRLHYDGTAFRGMIRREALARTGGLRRNCVDNFAADVTWLARIAQTGSLERVPQTLYRKRYDPESVSLKWHGWTDDQKIEAWCVHCRELLDVALELNPKREELQAIVRAILRRLLAIEPTVPFSFICGLPKKRKALMLCKLLHPLDRSRVGPTIAALLIEVFRHLVR
jgi:glycosyltransferase involved in cell wall biosynthesis